MTEKNVISSQKIWEGLKLFALMTQMLVVHLDEE
jgi:hypothetical protein